MHATNAQLFSWIALLMLAGVVVTLLLWRPVRPARTEADTSRKWINDGAHNDDLARFVLDGDPDVDGIVGQANNWIGHLTADRQGTIADAVQDGTQRVLQAVVHSIYEVLRQNRRLSFREDPHYDADLVQHIRPLRNTSMFGGTCLDLVLLFASCLANAKLNPLIVLIHQRHRKSHCLAAVWLPTVAGRRPNRPRQHLTIGELRTCHENGSLLLVECVGFALRDGQTLPFDKACAAGSDWLAVDDVETTSAIDVRRAWDEGYRPNDAPSILALRGTSARVQGEARTAPRRVAAHSAWRAWVLGVTIVVAAVAAVAAVRTVSVGAALFTSLPPVAIGRARSSVENAGQGAPSSLSDILPARRRPDQPSLSSTSPGPPNSFPAVPSHLTVISPIAGAVLLTWTDNSPNETHFEVTRQGVVVDLVSNGTAKAFTGLSRGVSFHWDVRACNGSGCSPPQGVVGKTPDGSDGALRSCSLVATGPDVWVKYAGHTGAQSNDTHWYTSLTGTAQQFLFNNFTGAVGAEIKIAHRFVPGEELFIGMLVNTTSQKYWNGPASRNPDGLGHFGYLTLDNDPKYQILGGFEETIYGGDRDFDDLVVKIGGVRCT